MSFTEEAKNWLKERQAKPLIDQVQKKRNYGTSPEKLRENIERDAPVESPKKIVDDEEKIDNLSERRQNALYFATPGKLSTLGTDLDEGTVIVPDGDEEAADQAALAHEMGHVEGTNAVANSRLIGPFLGSAGMTQTLGDNHVGAGLSMAATMAPTLVEEGRANLNADKILRDSGVEGEDLKDARKTLGKSFGSYLGATGLMGGIGYGLSKYLGNKMDKRSSMKSVGRHLKEAAQKPVEENFDEATTKTAGGALAGGALGSYGGSKLSKSSSLEKIGTEIKDATYVNN